MGHIQVASLLGQGAEFKGYEKPWFIEKSSGLGICHIPDFAENDVAELGFLKKSRSIHSLDPSESIGIDLKMKINRLELKFFNLKLQNSTILLCRY